MSAKINADNSVALAERLIRNGLRILLTNRCNYNCFFCHNEGLDPTKDGGDDIDPALIVRFVNDGVRDITLSGGEPLLNFKSLEAILGSLESELDRAVQEELEITIVTNGRLLNPGNIKKLATWSTRFSRLRLNVSLHSSDPEIYDAVTRTKGQLGFVKNNLRLALDAKLEVRLNFVLLRGYNVEEEFMKRAMRFSADLGIKRIKMIEFLVTKLNRNFYANFFRLDPLIFNNRHRATAISQYSQRKTSHTYLLDSNHEMVVDFHRCTCALGCIDCSKTRELEIAPGNQVIGCIGKPGIPFDPHKHSSLDIASLAAEQLNQMIGIYGNFSPSLAHVPEHVSGRAVFTIEQNQAVDSLFKSSLIISYREIRETRFVHRSSAPEDSDFTFLLIESDEETHSVIACFRENKVALNNLSWNEISYFDPVYDFSRTRAEVNRKKLQVMGYRPCEADQIVEETILLTMPRSDRLPVILRKRRYISTGKQICDLEVMKPDSGDWPPDEPGTSVLHFVTKYGFVIL